MRRILLFSIILGIGGIILGYLLFGKVAGEYIQIKSLFSSPNNFFEDITRTIAGISEIRTKILITGGGGVVLGLLIGLFFKKR